MNSLVCIEISAEIEVTIKTSNGIIREVCLRDDEGVSILVDISGETHVIVLVFKRVAGIVAAKSTNIRGAL